MEMKKLSLTLLGILIVLPAYSRDFTYNYEGQTLTYTIVNEDLKTCRTRKGSSNDDNTMNPGNQVSGDLVIPAVAIAALPLSYSLRITFISPNMPSQAAAA